MWRLVISRSFLFQAAPRFGEAAVSVQDSEKAHERWDPKPWTDLALVCSRTDEKGSEMDFAWIWPFISRALWFGAAAFFGGYLRTRAKDLATRGDVEKLTMVTKKIETKISNEAWDRKRRWELKRVVLFEVVKLLPGDSEQILSGMARIRGERSMTETTSSSSGRHVAILPAGLATRAASGGRPGLANRHSYPCDNPLQGLSVDGLASPCDRTTASPIGHRGGVSYRTVSVNVAGVVTPPTVAGMVTVPAVDGVV